MRTTKCSLLGLSAAAALASLCSAPISVRAADHGDSPALAHDQACDIADVFFFLDPNDNNFAVIIGTVRGFIVPGEAVNFAIFDHVVRNRFEIQNTGGPAPDKFIDVTFTRRKGGVDPLSIPNNKQALEIPLPQTATVKVPRLRGFAGGTFSGLPVLNPNLAGTANNPSAAVSTLGSSGISFFAGEVDDPFFFDIPGFARFIASIRTTGTPDVTRLQRGRDSFGGYNILAIALRIPVSLLTVSDDTDDATVGVRYLTQRRTLETPTSRGTTLARGAFRTVDSTGNPAVGVALVPFSQKDAFNPAPAVRGNRNPFTAGIVATLQALGTTDPNLSILASVAVNEGDYLRLNTDTPNLPTDRVGGGAPLEGSGFPNGRRLRDDTIDILLSLIGNAPAADVLAGTYALGDGTNASISQFPQTATFPFLAPAQQPFASADPANPTATDDRTQN